MKLCKSEENKPAAAGKYYEWMLLIFIMLLLTAGCRQDNVTQTVVVTEIVQMEGEAMVVTRIVQQEVEVVVTAPAPSGDGVIVTLDVNLDSRADTIDPQATIGGSSLDLIENLFVGLTNYDQATNAIEPELATTWTVSNDGRTWTFRLRDDVYWVQPGLDNASEIALRRPVVADDVVFAVQRACDPRLRTLDVFILFVIEGCEEVNRSLSPTDADLTTIGVRAPDEHTVVFKLNRPVAHFLALTSMWLTYPVPRDIVTAAGENWVGDETIVTSGPFALSPRSLAGARTVLLKNPAWPLPFSGNVDIVNVYYLDPADAFSLWEDKRLDVGPLPIAMEEEMNRDAPEKVLVVPDQAVFYLGLDFGSPALTEVEVRRAFSAAIDRERLIEEVYSGLGLPMRHFMPPGLIGAPPLAEVGVGYDPDYARQQMGLSSFRDCRLLPPMRFMTSSSDRALQQAELIRQMWVDELSCDESQFQIEQVQFGELLVNTQANVANRPDIWDLGWSPYYPDGQNWLEDVLHCQLGENRQERPCSAVDDIIESAGTSLDPAERTDLYRQAERLFFAADGLQPIIPLFVRAEFVAQQIWVQFEPTLFGGEHFDTYLVDPAQKELEQSQ